MTRTIQIPYRPSDRPLDVGAHARRLPPEHRGVTRQHALACELVGFRTADQMVLGLQELTTRERRRLLNLMRARAELFPS